MAPQRFVFNPLASSTPTGTTAHYLTSNEPAILLEEVNESATHRRHFVQMRALEGRALPKDSAAENPLFSNDLSLACREYRVHRIWVDAAHERELPDGKATSPEPTPPIGNAPARIVGRPPAGDQLIDLLTRQAAEEKPEWLFLFNVIVALEWLPTRQRLRRLQWAFRRASDYLYDVTNGGMAFGQVVFAGPSWLHGADIQILASNRFLPRSWVSGLLEAHKYTPIRMGRGLWVRDRHIVIDWDEPEGYRSIVHEWAHYALGLKDEYMRAQTVFEAGQFRLSRGEAPAGVPEVPIVDVDRRVKSESIMASVQGNSELENPLLRDGENSTNLRLVINSRYKNLMGRFERAWSGPGQLPLPLPHFRLAGELADPEYITTERIVAVPVLRYEAASAQPPPAQPQVPLDSMDFPVGRWELFLAQFQGAQPTRLSYQGEVDARAPERGFNLLGATDDDTLLLVGNEGGRQQVWSRPVGALNEEQELELVERQARILKSRAKTGGSKAQGDMLALPERVGELLQLAGWRQGPPLEEAHTLLGAQGAEQQGESPNTGSDVPANAADLLPLSTEDGFKISARVKLRLNGAPATIFDVAGAQGRPVKDLVDTVDLPSLDGYAVTIGQPDPAAPEAGATLMIADFSQGGPPRSAPAMVSDPIAAGAASGEALILCDVDPEDEAIDTSAYRVVTASIRGLQLPSGFTAQSPVYSIASNLKLLQRFTPSLLIVNTAPAAAPVDDLRICRFTQTGELEVLPTYLDPKGAYGIAPLMVSTGGSLISAGNNPAREPEGEYIERFVLARVPAARLRAGQKQATPDEKATAAD